MTHGGAKGAATELGTTEDAVKATLARMRRRTGLTTMQLIARGAREGWLKEAA